MSTNIDEILVQRGNRYGDFKGHAEFTQALKSICHHGLGKNETFLELPKDQQSAIVESLDMIMHKVGRILNGDPTYDDSWVDIGGYAKLVADMYKNA